MGASIVLVLCCVLAVLSACRGGLIRPTLTEGLATPTPVPVESEEPEEAIPTESSDEGLTYEEFRSTTPPPPQSLRIEALEGGMRLDWAPPEVVESLHGYSDTIIYYNIYRRTEDTDFQLLDSSSSTSYLDKSAKPGTTYYYTVSAVHEGPVEGETTSEVSVTAEGP